LRGVMRNRTGKPRGWYVQNKEAREIISRNTEGFSTREGFHKKKTLPGGAANERQVEATHTGGGTIGGGGQKDCKRNPYTFSLDPEDLGTFGKGN